MFQFPDCPLPTLCVQVGVLEDHSSGLPHSEIRGSKLDCSSPRRIAAYRVLHRPFAPRHPPCALCNLKPKPRASPKKRKIAVHGTESKLREKHQQAKLSFRFGVRCKQTFRFQRERERAIRHSFFPLFLTKIVA